MKRLRLISMCLILLVTGVACVVNPKFRMPSAEEIRTRMERQIQDDSLERGRSIAIADCADCHRQYWPAEYDARRWPTILKEMGARASLSPVDIDAITAYMTHASDVVRSKEFD